MNTKYIWKIFIAALAIVLPIRIIQLLYLNKQNAELASVFTLVIFGCLFLATALFIIMCRFEKNSPKAYAPIKNNLAGTLVAVTSIAMLYHSVSTMVQVSANKPDQLSSAKSSTQNTISIMGVAQLEALNAVLAVVGIACAIIFIVTAYGYFTGKNIFKNLPILALVPPIWGIICIVVLFISCTATVNTAENAYDIFTVIFCLLFFFYQAKLFAGIEEERSRKYLNAFGFSAMLFTLLTSVTGITTFIAKVNMGSTFSFSFHLLNLFLAFYIGCFLLCMRFSAKKILVME